MQLSTLDFMKSGKKAWRTKDLFNCQSISNGYLVRNDGMPVFVWKIREGINVLNKEQSVMDEIIQNYTKLFENLADGDVIQIITSARPLDSAKILSHYKDNIKLQDRVTQELILPAHEEWVDGMVNSSFAVDICHYILFSLYKKPGKGTPESILDLLRQKSVSITSYLHNCGLEAEKLNPYEIKDLLDREINPFLPDLSNKALDMAAPISSNGKTGFSSIPDMLARDAVIPHKDHLEFGCGGVARTMYLETLPFNNFNLNSDTNQYEYSSNIFTPAIFFNCGYFRMSLYAYGINQDQAKKNFKKQFKEFAQLDMDKKTGFKRENDAETEVSLARTQVTLMRAANGLLHYNKFNFMITLYSDSLQDLTDKTNQFKSMFNDFHLKDGFYEQDRLLASSLPFCEEKDKDHAGHMSSDGLANAFSFLSAKTGTSTGVLVGFDQFGEPVFFDPWLRGGEIDNGITVKIGQPGSGKSFSEEVESLLLYPMDVVSCIFHKSSSYYYSNQLMGGQNIRFGINSDTKINIMEPADPAEISSGNVSVETILTILGALEIMLFDDEKMDMLNKSLLEDAIRETYINNAGKIPLLEDLANSLDTLAGKQTVKEHKLLLKNLRVKLNLFIGKGSYADMMNRHSTVKINSNRIVVDLSDLADHNKMLFNLAMYLCANIAYKVKYIAESKGISRALIKFDETWAFIASQYGQELIANLARRQRHLNVAVYLSTQFISDLDASDTVKAFLRAAQTKFLFKQPTDDRKQLGEAFQFTNKELDLIYSIGGGKNFKQAYIVTGARKGIVNVMSNRHFYWIITSENHREAPLRDKITKQHTDEAGNVDYVSAIKELVELEKQ